MSTFGDQPFFGGSIFQTPTPVTPPAPPPPVTPPEPPKPDYGGTYKYGPTKSGFEHAGGDFTGYSGDNNPMKFFDRGNHVH